MSDPECKRGRFGGSQNVSFRTEGEKSQYTDTYPRFLASARNDKGNL